LGSCEKQVVQEISRLPENATYTFDEDECYSKVLKTAFRHKIISLEYTKFQAREKVRHFPKATSLSIIVPKGANYAYDIISAVGVGSFIEGRKLSDIKQELEKQIPNFTIPYSSLYDQQRKFLFYFGQLHRASAALIRDYLDSFGNVGWLIDGTLEPGTDVFFGVKDCLKNIMLDCFKIPTENEKDIQKCLQSVGSLFGRPNQIIHDLSRTIQAACDKLDWDVVQLICHFHFSKDVGSDLYALPNEKLSKQLKKLKLKLYLKTQRNDQGKWLRKTVNTRNDLMLEKLLNEQEVPQIDNAILGRELFFSLNHWMLDCASDGSRQGFPFDPYLLYFHRRIQKVHTAINKILESPSSQNVLPRCLGYLSEKLETYMSDPEIITASSLYETAFEIFTDIRSSLRLLNADKSKAPIYETYEISPLEQEEILSNIFALKIKLNEDKQKNGDESAKALYDIALKHIVKYEPYLINESGLNFDNKKIVRSTNKLEQHWGAAKRIKRQITGKKKLNRELNALPKEYMLVQNLNNPDYVEVVLGNIEKLPQKLAEVAKNAGPFTRWVTQQDVTNICKINKNLLRKDNFIENLVEISQKAFNDS